MKKRGAPPHVPTSQTMKTVETMGACGITHEQIAACIGISADTLKKYYSNELATASSKANSAMGSKLYATGMAGNVTAMIFWLKTRAGWTERMELSGKDGTPLIAVIKDA